MAGMAVVYSSDCPSGLERVAADATYVFQCTGAGDQAVINAAISAVAATGQNATTPPSGGGGSVVLAGWNFNVTAPVQIQSWVDLSGAFGRAGCQVNASPGFSGTAVIENGQAYSEYYTIRDLRVNGTRTGTEHGVYLQAQSVQTPFTYADPVPSVSNLIIMNTGAAGIYLDTNLRVATVSGLRIGKAGTYGGYFANPDSIFSDIQSLGSGSDGFWCGGSDNTYSQLRSDNAHGNGFTLQASRHAFANCESEDPALHGWNVVWGKCGMTGCSSDSAGLGNTGYNGFNLASGQAYISMRGCMSYDRNATPHQAYGVWIGSTALTYSLIDCVTYGNATGSFGGNTTPGTGSTYTVTGT